MVITRSSRQQGRSQGMCLLGLGAFDDRR